MAPDTHAFPADFSSQPEELYQKLPDPLAPAVPNDANRSGCERYDMERMPNILHILNGDAPRPAMEQAGLPGTFSAWPDVLHEGRTPLATGEEWIRVRCEQLASLVPDPHDGFVEQYRASDAVLESWRDRDEVVFWFEHDLFDQLLLIRHLWWLTTNAAERAERNTRFSLVCGRDYVGLLQPPQFGPKFAAREPIGAAQIRLGAAVWEAYCGGDPMRLLPFAEHAADNHTLSAAEHARVLPYLPAAIRRLLEEFPSASNGLARSERQILDVLSEGARTPEQAFVAASRLEEAIYMGDLSFWNIVKGMTDVRHPLVTAEVQERSRRLPDGMLRITDVGRAVLAGRADHAVLNGISRWLGGTRLSADRLWRWTGSSLLPPAA